MNLKYFITIFTLLFVISVRSFSQSDLPCNSCEYMTIISEFDGSELYLIFITQPDGQYEKIKLEKRGTYASMETTAILELLEKYNDEGWKLESSNLTDNNIYFLLSRERSKKEKE